MELWDAANLHKDQAVQLLSKTSASIWHRNLINAKFKVSLTLSGDAIAKSTISKVQSFTNYCLRRIFWICWPDTISNLDLWHSTNQMPAEGDIRTRRWMWIGFEMDRAWGSQTVISLSRLWSGIPMAKRKEEGQETHGDITCRLMLRRWASARDT